MSITIFFLISGDSDYTSLIQRLRATNCQVIGVGNPAKNASLISACNRFILLTHPHQEQAGTSPKKKVTTKIPTYMRASVSSFKKGSTMYQGIGIFINGDNQPPSYLETVVKIASFWGTILACYVYCATNSHKWQQTCHEYGAEFIPQRKSSTQSDFGMRGRVSSAPLALFSAVVKFCQFLSDIAMEL